MGRFTKSYKEKLKDQIKVKLRKHPHANLAEMKEFILEEDPTVFDDVNRNQLNSFLNYNMAKFSETGSLNHRLGAGRPSTITQEKKDEIVEICKEKRFTGTTRKAAATCDVSQTSVRRVLKDAGLKSFSAKPVQKMTGRQQMNRYFGKVCNTNVIYNIVSWSGWFLDTMVSTHMGWMSAGIQHGGGW